MTSIGVGLQATGCSVGGSSRSARSRPSPSASAGKSKGHGAASFGCHRFIFEGDLGRFRNLPPPSGRPSRKGLRLLRHSISRAFVPPCVRRGCGGWHLSDQSSSRIGTLDAPLFCSGKLQKLPGSHTAITERVMNIGSRRMGAPATGSNRSLTGT
jgi:hypothetical protein